MTEIPTIRIKRQDLYDQALPSGLAAPARRALIEAGYTTLALLAGASEAQIERLHGIGPNALNLLRSTLHANGLSFANESNGHAEIRSVVKNPI